MTATSASAFEIKSLGSKGRGLVATRDIKGGEVVLSEEPLFLYGDKELDKRTCARCLRLAERGKEYSIACDGCNQAWFCGAECKGLSNAGPSAHTPEYCAGLKTIAAAKLEPHTEVNCCSFVSIANQLLLYLRRRFAVRSYGCRR